MSFFFTMVWVTIWSTPRLRVKVPLQTFKLNKYEVRRYSEYYHYFQFLLVLIYTFSISWYTHLSCIDKVFWCNKGQIVKCEDLRSSMSFVWYCIKVYIRIFKHLRDQFVKQRQTLIGSIFLNHVDGLSSKPICVANIWSDVIPWKKITIMTIIL